MGADPTSTTEAGPAEGSAPTQDSGLGPASNHPSTSPAASGASGNAAALYALISADADLTQSLFRQALQDPSGALARIVAIGAEKGLTVEPEEVRRHLASLEDGSTKQWLLKARGGL
jgi:hypothetical protein